MSLSNPYKVLQVDPEAEDEVIEAAYRRLARKYHPDVATGPDAQERMVQINQAWEMLRDPIRRASVDRARARAAATSARVAAAEAREDVRGTASSGGRHAPYRSATAGTSGTSGTTGTSGTARTAGPSDASRDADGGQARGWPLPGMHSGGDSTDRVSPDWPTGRSTAGGGYDPQTMGTAQGHGSAGPPPGNPSGSMLGFGRYAGWSLGEIARTDLEYLEWLDRTPIGRIYQPEIDVLLRSSGRRTTAPRGDSQRRGLFRRR
jgi:hypothetical protein